MHAYYLGSIMFTYYSCYNLYIDLGRFWFSSYHFWCIGVFSFHSGHVPMHEDVCIRLTFFKNVRLILLINLNIMLIH